MKLRSSGGRGAGGGMQLPEAEQRCPARRPSPGEVSRLGSHLELGSSELPGCLLSLKTLGWKCAGVSLFTAARVCVGPVGSRYAADGLRLGKGLEGLPYSQRMCRFAVGSERQPENNVPHRMY